MLKSKVLVVVIALPILLASCGGSSTPAGTATGDTPTSQTPDADAGDKSGKGGKGATNEPAPEWDGPNFEVTTFSGDTFELAAQAGHPVVLNFWESW